jgi:hypothetical protein
MILGPPLVKPVVVTVKRGMGIDPDLQRLAEGLVDEITSPCMKSRGYENNTPDSLLSKDLHGRFRRSERSRVLKGGPDDFAQGFILPKVAQSLLNNEEGGFGVR